MNILLREADHLLLGIPMLSCMAVGAGAGLLQQIPYSSAKTVGWLGMHSAIILGVVCGVPLMVYSMAKVIFATSLNALTLNKFDCVRSFKEHAEMQFMVTSIAVSSLSLVVLALPHVIQSAYKAYQTYQEVQKVYDDFVQSDFYITMCDLYTKCQQFLKGTPSPLVPAGDSEITEG